MVKKAINNLGFLTNPDKILFNKLQISKKMLAEFYIDIQDWILPHLINVPLTILRCPEGSDKPCFFQKHPNETIPKEICSIDYKYKNKIQTYLYIKDLKGLLALVQLGALEIHTWNCEIDDLLHPVCLLLDLDPDIKFSFSQIIEGALILNKFLTALKLKTFLKTTGRKGLDIVIPLARKDDRDAVLAFAREVALLMSKKYPDMFVANMRKSDRKGRIFIDYLRNVPAATCIAPFSTRATENVGIATPITWKELPKIKSGEHFNFINLRNRLNKMNIDPWRNFF